jgi:hypothetical protein
MTAHKFLKVTIPNHIHFLKVDEGKVLVWFERLYKKIVSRFADGTIEVLDTLPKGETATVYMRSDLAGNVYENSKPHIILGTLNSNASRVQY